MRSFLRWLYAWSMGPTALAARCEFLQDRLNRFPEYVSSKDEELERLRRVCEAGKQAVRRMERERAAEKHELDHELRYLRFVQDGFNKHVGEGAAQYFTREVERLDRALREVARCECREAVIVIPPRTSHLFAQIDEPPSHHRVLFDRIAGCTCKLLAIKALERK